MERTTSADSAVEALNLRYLLDYPGEAARQLERMDPQEVADLLAQQPLWMRVLALLALLIAAVVVFFVSEPGKQLIGFGRDSWREVKKVVWPTRKEAMQTTAFVFAFAVVMALFLWMTDKTLEWVFYDLILGWRK